MTTGASDAFVGRYRVVRELGRGGWGVVVEAIAEPEGTPVALKRLLPRALLLQPDAAERLRRELGAARAVEHPGVVRALDAGSVDGAPFVVYELVRGARTIVEAFAGRDLPARVALVRDAASALGAAHARGVVHRDVSARNVLVGDDGRVRVTDFGLAWLPGQPSLTRTGVVLGTPSAVAPEAALEGSKATTAPSVDVWALGLLLFEALTGAPPFGPDGVVPRLVEASAAAPGPADVDPSVPAALDLVCRRALADDPTARFADGAALAAALDLALEQARGWSPPPGRPSARLPRALGPGARLGPYVVQARIGAGGMGAVYRARDEALGRDVALKVLHGVDSAERRGRFVREQQAAARVRHENIVAVHGAGEVDGVAWLAMDLVAGEPLDQALQRGPLPPAAALRVVAGCARAVEALHAVGVLHRDLKPGNVLVDERGAPRLTDFGVARVSDAERLTRTGQALGTPLYMAPEQLSGERVDERADVYGLGAVLYEALVGSLPWTDAPTLIALMQAKCAPPPRPSTRRPGLDAGVDVVCLRALAPTPAERYPSAAALARDLEVLLAGGTVRAPARRRRPRGAIALGVGLGVAALLGAAAYARRAPDAAASRAALAALRADVEARARAARSLSSVDVDRDAAAAAIDRAGQAAADDADAVRAWLGLLALARGDEVAARAALPTLASAVAVPDAVLAADDPAVRALRGGLAAGSGDPAAAVDDLQAAMAAGVRHPEVEAWLLRALARRGLERADAAAWLSRVPALRARADVRAPAADLLEVACALGLERRLEAEQLLGRLEAAPPEVRWDLATLTAADHVSGGAPPAGLEAVAAAVRPPGPRRPQEAVLARRFAGVLEVRFAGRDGHRVALGEAELLDVTGLLELKARVCPGGAIDPELARTLVEVTHRTILVVNKLLNLPLLLALSDAWPEDPTIQVGAVTALFMDRFAAGHWLLPRRPEGERRLARAAERALAGAQARPDVRLQACLLRAVTLFHASGAQEVLAASRQLADALADPMVRASTTAREARGDALLLRARIAGRHEGAGAALALLDAAQQVERHDALSALLVRYELLVAAGRVDDAERLLVELSSDPPRIEGGALLLLAEAAWSHLRRAGRWEALDAFYAGVHDLLPAGKGAFRYAWLRARAGDLERAFELVERRNRVYGSALSGQEAAVRRGDPAALRALEAEAELPLHEPW